MIKIGNKEINNYSEPFIITEIAANPEELGIIVKECKRAYKMLGSHNRIVNEPQERLEIFIRRIVSTRNIKKGVKILKEYLTCKRPGTGLEPKYINFIIGRQAKRDIEIDSLLSMENF